MFGKPVPCECHKEQIKQARIMRLRDNSGLSREEIEQWTFDTFDPSRAVSLGCDLKACQEWTKGLSPEWKRRIVDCDKKKCWMLIKSMSVIKETCQQYSAEPKGWMMLQGPFGCGKTHLAAAIANEQWRRGRSVLFMTAGRLMAFIRETFSNEKETYEQRIRDVFSVELLIIDDLGTENPTPWVMSELFEIINQRYVHRLPLVITTNLSLNDPKLDPRIVSRMRQGSAVKDGNRIITIAAGDARPFIGG
jgi:DNA replication protein DnaC